MSSHSSQKKGSFDRRSFLKHGGRLVGLVGLGGVATALVARNHSQANSWVWQIDPNKCINCGKCEDHCILNVSAVKCMHNHHMCGYCELCTGFFIPNPSELDSGAENQLCPTAAITRKFVEEPYYEYFIDRDLCIGCGKCSEGCSNFGNGSLFLQIDHSRCEHCNHCAIADACPSQALVKVPAESPYLAKGPDLIKDVSKLANAPEEESVSPHPPH